MQQCLFCGYMVILIYAHGHYQCPVCNTNALPCCDGDNCDTNNLLSEKSAALIPDTKKKSDERNKN